MNKYLRNGLLMTAAGIILCLLGYYLKAQELNVYKWTMIVGVILFGIGFLTILYSLIRKVERRSLEQDRREKSGG